MTRAALMLLVMMLTATTAWAGTVYDISYIDADGNPAKCERAAVVTADMGGTSESKFKSNYGWFYVRNSVTLDGAYCNSPSVQNIILGDGATLTINGRFRFLNSVNIYCQSGGTGRLIVNGSSSGEAIFTVPRSKTLTINGGTVEVTNTAYTGYGFGGNLVMNGGTASFTSKEGSRNCAIDGDVTINGGTFTATSGSLAGVCSGTMMIADGKYFIDGSGDIYTGTLNGEQKKALSGKTLTLTNITQTEYIQASLGAGNDGSVSKPYTISNANGWNAFCLALQDNDTWNRFTGKTVKLGADITVTSMAGSSGHEFCGTFDGDHHTLTVQYGTADAPIEQQQFVAPFVETARNSSPVFRNLTIDGNIYVNYTSNDEPGVGGLIGHLFGDVTVEHCTSNVVINSDKDRVGGFVGLCEYAVTFTDCKSSASVSSSIGNISGFVGWSRASTFTIAFEGCLFNGKLLQLNGTGGSGGCFVGWKGDAKTVNTNNCLVAPATLAEGESMASSGSATFCRQHNDKLPAEIKNSYYTTAFGTAQGTQVHSIKAGKGVSVAMAGNVINEYETSGITFYNTGIMCDGKLYAVKDDVVSLTLSHDSSINDLFLGYEAKDSLQNTFALNADGDNYKLTMPDDDVTISAKVAMLYSLTLPDRMEVVSATPAAIGGKYKEGTTIQFKVKSEDYVLEGDVMNGDDVLTVDDDGIYTVTVGNADITITLKKTVEPNVTLSGGDYTAQNGDVLTGSTNGTVTIADGDSITLSDVTINGGIICEGTATITLVGENNVTGLGDKAGIQVGNKGTTLTIKGNGSLAAKGGDGGAGIGTGFVVGETVIFGDIIIEGGSITATGGDRGAGIGTGSVDQGNVTLGNITIEGGTITATGGDRGAGIGTGLVDVGTATLDNITIKGGNITAKGGEYGAGIGTGLVDGGTVTLGDIIIEGGSITATGGDFGAGIGTGYVGYGGTAKLGDITIKGGSITATGGMFGAGIGKGAVDSENITIGTLTIYDDIDLVYATGNGNPGISEEVVYKHGETNVTGNASYYFIINHDDFSDVIKARKYAITLVNEEQHGTVTVAESAKCDESVTITVTPDSGYMLDTIEVKDANGNDVPLSDMSFTMPKSDVTITVTWKLAGVKGDVNRDGNVDISDVVALVNIILNSSSDHQAEADLNNDGNIDISDVVALVNIILGQ